MVDVSVTLVAFLTSRTRVATITALLGARVQTNLCTSGRWIAQLGVQRDVGLSTKDLPNERGAEVIAAVVITSAASRVYETTARQEA